MKILLAPLHKIAKLSEESKEELTKIQILSLQIKTVAIISAKELKKQTVLLTDIRDLIKQQVDKKDKGGSGMNIKMPSILGTVRGVMVIVSMAAAILAASGIISMMPDIKTSQLLTAIAVAGLFVILTPVFLAITNAFARSGGRLILDRITGNSMGAGSFKGIMQMVGVGGAAMISMAAAVTASAYILTFMPSGGINAAQFVTALAVGVIMIPLSYAITGVMIGLRRSGLKLDLKSIKKLVLIPLILGAMAAGLVASAWILKGLPSDMPDVPIGALIAISIVILAMSLGFSIIVKATKKITKKQLIITGAAIPVIALAMVIAAYIFNALPDDMTSIDPIWAFSAAFAVAIFAIPFVLISKLTKGIKYEDIGTTVTIMAALSVVMLIVAWIFSGLPDEYGSIIPMEWAIGTAVSIAAFAGAFKIVAMVAQSLTPMGMLYGAGGMILLAVVMFIVAWIFSELPDLSAISKNITDALMYPVNSMITALARFKNEIGIENMLPLAGGLFAISAGWLALTAALGGQAIGGLLGSMANLGTAIFDGIASFFGAEKTMTPISLLEKLVKIQPGLEKLAKPMKTLGWNFMVIAKYSEKVITAINAFEPFMGVINNRLLASSATQVAKIAKGYKDISDASKVMNVDAINASTKMFNSIAAIAKNNGDDAITAISKELMAAVKELSETVKNLEEVTEAGSQSMTDAFLGGLKTLQNKIIGSSDDAESELTQAGMSFADVVIAIESLQDRFDTPIKVKTSTQFS